jgi:hypothetical protein
MHNLTFDPTALVELVMPYITVIGVAALVLAVLMTATIVVITRE